MASNTMSVRKPISRSAGKTATAAAAYRSGQEIVDQRTGEVHDYTRKQGVVSAEIVTPAGVPPWATDRAELWNHAEASETRKNSRVGREFLAGLPHELDDDQRHALAHDFARQLVDRYGFAADVCIHRPDREGDQRNHHAHILTTTRRLSDGGFGGKVRELDDKKQGPKEVRFCRELFQEVTNKHLAMAGVDVSVDMRSFEAQGLDYEPQIHMGPAIAGIERRNPGSTVVGRENQARAERNLEREIEHQDIEHQELEIAYLEDQESEISVEMAVVQHEIEQREIERGMVDVRRLLRSEIAPKTEPEPAPTPSPAPAPAAPPRQLTQWQEAHKPKPNPSDRILSVMVSKTLDERPMPEPDGTVWEARPLEAWCRERWEKVKELAEGLAQAARERLKPIFDRQAAQRAESAGYRPESIESAGLTPSEPPTNPEQPAAQEAPQNPPENPGPDLDLDDLDDDEPTGPRLG